LPRFTTNDRQISTAQPNAYWCGRFQALSDRFRNELLEASLKEPLKFKEFMTSSSSSSTTPEITGMQINWNKIAISGKPIIYREEIDSETAFHDATEKFLKDEEDRRSKRVFTHLEALCLTPEAKKSLWEWQLAYARKEKKEKLLPLGAKMTDDRNGWVSRVGRALIRTDTSMVSLMISGVYIILFWMILRVIHS
jgi:hypothetical protein